MKLRLIIWIFAAFFMSVPVSAQLNTQTVDAEGWEYVLTTEGDKKKEERLFFVNLRTITSVDANNNGDSNVKTWKTWSKIIVRKSGKETESWHALAEYDCATDRIRYLRLIHHDGKGKVKYDSSGNRVDENTPDLFSGLGHWVTVGPPGNPDRRLLKEVCWAKVEIK